MKKNNGFTLMELLAVIVVISVLIIILVPLILNIINTVKKSAAGTSASNYLTSVELLFANDAINNVTLSDGSYDAAAFVTNKMKGTFPSLGDVVIQNNKIVSIDICVNGYQFERVNNKMVLKSNDCFDLEGKPTYSLSEGMDVITASKTVSVYYPSESVTRYFMVTNGKASYQSTIVANNEWIEVTGNTAEIIFLENGTLTTKVNNGVRDVSGNTIIVGNIDSISPTKDISSFPTTINYDAQDSNTVYKFDDYVTFGTLGGTTTCTSDLLSGINLLDTAKLPSGTNNLACTSVGNNGKTTSFNLTINVTVKIDYTVDSIIQGIDTLELPNGDYNLTVSTVTYPIELINYYSDTVISSNVSLGDTSTTKKMLVVKFHKNLTVNASVTVTATNVSSLTYKKGMYIYVGGTLTNNGKITMTARGTYNQAGENVYLYKNNDSTYEMVPAIGASGAAAVSLTNAPDDRKSGNPGGAGTLRKTGGGGSGGVFNNVSGTAVSGVGGAGTSYSGGAGGGATAFRGSGTYGGYAGSSTGGAGGAGHSNNYSNSGGYNAGGGAGNLGGVGAGTSCCTHSSGANGTGGLLIISANKIINTGVIAATGVSGGYGSGASGGSSGGGSINIFVKEDYSSTGTVSANDTVAQSYGGRGGAGSVTIGSISTGTFVSN